MASVGINLLKNSEKYHTYSPYVLTGGGKSDVFEVTDMTAVVTPGHKYTLSFQTDGWWGSGHSYDASHTDKILIWIYYYTTHDCSGSAATTVISNSDESLRSGGAYTFTTRTDAHSIKIMVQTYATSSTTVTRKFWNFKLENGATATQWTPYGFRNNGNLIVNSDIAYSSATYNICSYKYYPITPLIEGDTYTVTMCVTPSEGTTEIGLWMSGGSTQNVKIPVSGTSKQTVSVAFNARYYHTTPKTPADDSTNASLNAYRLPNPSDATIGTTTIHWIVVQAGDQTGSKPTAHQPSYKDTNYSTLTWSKQKAGNNDRIWWFGCSPHETTVSAGLPDCVNRMVDGSLRSGDNFWFIPEYHPDTYNWNVGDQGVMTGLHGGTRSGETYSSDNLTTHLRFQVLVKDDLYIKGRVIDHHKRRIMINYTVARSARTYTTTELNDLYKQGVKTTFNLDSAYSSWPTLDVGMFAYLVARNTTTNRWAFIKLIVTGTNSTNKQFSGIPVDGWTYSPDVVNTDVFTNKIVTGSNRNFVYYYDSNSFSIFGDAAGTKTTTKEDGIYKTRIVMTKAHSSSRMFATCAATGLRADSWSLDYTPYYFMITIKNNSSTVPVCWTQNGLRNGKTVSIPAGETVTERVKVFGNGTGYAQFVISTTNLGQLADITVWNAYIGVGHEERDYAYPVTSTYKPGTIDDNFEFPWIAKNQITLSRINDVKTLTSVVRQYCANQDSQNIPGNSATWVTDPPKWREGYVLWVRDQYNWNDPNASPQDFTTYSKTILDPSWEAGTSVNTNLSEHITSYDSFVEETKEKFAQVYTRDEVDKELGTVLASSTTSITQTANEIRIDFDSFVKEDYEKYKEGVDAKLDNYDKYITFEAGNIILGDTNSNYACKITNQKISFMYGDNEVAYISQNQLYIKSARITSSIYLGSFRFVVQKLSNGKDRLDFI